MPQFAKHPSPELVRMFHEKPYQCQSPEKAEIIFLSSDANYSERITEHDFFERILEYQEDGIKFWKDHECHHPFMLKEYPFSRSKGGVPFHRNFSKLQFKPIQADKICFLELLDVPTIGNKTGNIHVFDELINLEHLEYIDQLISLGDKKLFFIPGGVLNDMKRLKNQYNNIFQWLKLIPNETFLFKSLSPALCQGLVS
jgi:hypothetical protein